MGFDDMTVLITAARQASAERPPSGSDAKAQR